MPNDSGFAARALDRALVDLALSGLSRPQKTLPAKLFYDEEGCRLFYRITELPEYYLTRTETALLPRVAAAVLATLPDRAILVEYGASEETKAAFLLAGDEGGRIKAYAPIDVAMPALQEMSARLARSHPHLAVHPIVADFTDPVTLPRAVAAMPRLGFFPGSTIGNLDPDDAVRFLALARRTLGNRARLLVGVDLRKDPSLLLPAYDDAAGVTAAFNRNILVRLNREAGANFDTDAFAHRAVWNDAESRIEMHLVSRESQIVSIAGQMIHFARGETIHTENSYKYTAERFAAIAAGAGWQREASWTDPRQLFALFLLRPDGAV
ncbi:MAG TPA: L-histidine N(alpha)-methyltransferase [Acetobacteraceae bacterium]|jgi:L-histidine Nalpha-methyltransferase|nr:L-histidine N(alpha)-methyltransferase [Acetobacteraceae bacterium]